jgi:hypothetical protein
MKIRSVGAELFHAGVRADGRTGRRTDMAKVIVAFRNFAKVPNNDFFFLQCDSSAYCVTTNSSPT